MKYDYAVFIGRFSPFHKGHLKIVTEALKLSDYLIMVIGSSNRGRNTRNPFTVEERKRIIQASLPSEFLDRVILTESDDSLYNDDKWLSGIQNAVDGVVASHAGTAKFTYTGWRDYKYNIALAGMYKDASSYYINCFPQWDKSIAVTPEENIDDIFSATAVRNRLFNGDFEYIREIDAGPREFIKRIMDENPEAWAQLHADWNHEQKYESLWGKGPHTTVDAVVVQAGHVLLVTRGGDYGQGTLAIPGGFINYREKILDACIRELREETLLKVPEKVLRGSITRRECYDDPHRSNRGHIITHAFKFELANVGELPKVKGSDDAKKAKWYPISSINKMKTEFFEDHYDVLDDLLNL